MRLVQLTYSLRKHLAGSFVEGRLGLLDQSLLANLLLFLRLFEGSVLKSFGLSMQIFECLMSRGPEAGSRSSHQRHAS